MTDTPALGTVSRISEDAVDTAVGGASIALDAVRDPEAGIEAARRRGSRITARLSGEAESTLDEAASLPERMLFSGLRALRTRARRSDVGGVAARSVLLMVHRPAGGAARVLERIERETAPPDTTDRRRRRSTAGTSAGRGRTTGTSSGRGRTTGTSSGRGRTAGTSSGRGHTAPRGATASPLRSGSAARGTRRTGASRPRRTA